jgi:hypothetical protein
MHTFFRRVIDACRLRPALYEDVEADRSALGQAFLVVVLSSFAVSYGLHSPQSPVTLITSAAAAILGWLLWAWIAFLVGTRLLPEKQTVADWGELLRTTGFATAPGMIAILGVFPAFTGFIVFVASLWMFASFAVAVRQALDYKSIWRAIVVCLCGWLAHALILYAMASPLRMAPYE